MRRSIIASTLALTFFCGIYSVLAQNTQTFINRPLTELLDLLESRSHYRIYCDPSQIEGINISADISGTEITLILEKALEGTDFKISVAGNSIFILSERKLVTKLPEGILDPVLKATIASPDEFASILEKEEQRAASEFRLYEIGDPSATGMGRAVLSGYVVDARTGEPVQGVYVYIPDTNISSLTDAYGYYSLNLRPGRYDVMVTGGGQQDQKRQVQLYSSGKLDIESYEKVYTFKEVTVVDERRDRIRQTTLGVERLQMREIKNIPTAFGESDILQVVTSLPGVKSVGEVSSGFNVRGGATDQNLILFNEGTIFNPTHLFGMFSAFNPDVVRDIELYKSSIPSKFGGRISSVLDITSREGNKKEFKGSASIGLLTSRLTVEGPILKDRTSFILGGRTTYSDWILGQLPESSGYKDGKAGFYDINAMLNHKFSERTSLYFTGYYSQDRFRFEKTELYKYRNANASMKLRHVFSPDVIGHFSAGYDHYDYDTENTADSITAYSLKFKIDQFFGKADFNWSLSSKHTLNFGINTLYYQLEPGIFDPKGKQSIIVADRLQKDKALESAIYIGDKWNVTDKFTVDAGIRYSIFNVLGDRTYNTYAPGYLPSEENVTEVKNGTGVMKTYHGPEFRLSLRYAFTDDMSIKAGVNSMRQYIHKVSNTSIMSPTDTWKLSDMNIKPQTGIQYALGIYKNFLGNMIETSIEGYYKTMDDYLDYRNGAELMMNHHIETDVLPTKGRAYGVEFMIKKNTGKLNGWVSYAYSRTELKQDDKRITSPVNNGGWYPTDFDKPHEFKFIGNYKFTHRVSVSLNAEYMTGRPITLPVSKYEYAGGQYVFYSDRNKYRVPDYFRMDLAFNLEPSHHLTLLTHSMFSIGVYNLTGRKNAHSVYYKAEDGKIKGYKLAIFGSPIPYASYNIKF